VYDITETSISPSCTRSEIILFCKDTTGENVAVRIPDVKFYLFVEVIDDEDPVKIVEDINKNVRINKNKCYRTNCCGNKGGMVLNLCPCGKKLLLDKTLTVPIINYKVIWKKSCVMYRKEYQKILQLELARSYLATSISNYLKNQRDVFEVYSDPVYSFNYSFDKKREICTGSILDEAQLTTLVKNNQKTKCTREYLCSYDKLPLLKNTSFIPPLKEMSIDIEVSVSNKKEFPTPEKEQIFLISTGDVSFTWMDGVNSPYKTEAQMLYGFLEYLDKEKPDVLYGHYGNTFDWPFIFERCRTLSVSFDLSKLKNERVIFLKATRSSRGKGTNMVSFVYCPGILFVDTFEYAVNNYKLPSYGLDSFAKHILKIPEAKKKFDLKKSNAIFHGKDLKEKQQYMEYNRVDAQLPLLIAKKCMILKNVLIEAQIVGMTARQLMVVGVQEQGLCISRRFFWVRGFLMPQDAKFVGLPEITEIEGASVIKARKGYYKCYISNLDVKSMYPSIMRSSNLSLDTLCADNEGGEAILCKESGYYFVPATTHKGLLPEMLELLISERNAVKEEMEKETDEEIKTILDIKQNKLKVKANAVYGATGGNGKFRCPYITASTTAIGRKCFATLQKFMTEEKKLEVVYGDTDSIFFISKETTVAGVLREGKALKNEINAKGVLPPLVEIDHEYCRRLIMFTKKKYISINYKNDNDRGKLSHKGTVTVKTDNAQFISRFFDQLTNKVLIDLANKDEIEVFVRRSLYDLWNRDASISVADLTFSKKYSKKISEYKDIINQEHMQVLRHWERWDPITAPSIGEKIPYVFINLPSKSAKVSERCRPPFMVSSIKEIDVSFFIESRLKQPLTSFLEVLGFDGEEIRAIFNPPYTVSKNQEEWYKFNEGPLLLSNQVIKEEYLNTQRKKIKCIG